MFLESSTFVEPERLDPADLSRLDLLFTVQPPVGLQTRAIALTAAIGMAAQALLLPPPAEMSLSDYMNEAYHEVICGNGPRRAIDPAVFARIRAVLAPMAEKKQAEDERSGKLRLNGEQAPPPVPPLPPCCGGPLPGFILRRRGRQPVPA